MSWRDLLQKTGETKIFPWLGGRSLRSGDRVWFIEGATPRENGYYRFKLSGKKAHLLEKVPDLDYQLQDLVKGYLVGDRLLVDGTDVNPDPSAIAEQAEPVHLLEVGIERFSRILAGRTHNGGELIFAMRDFPIGPEEDVAAAYRAKYESVTHIKGVTPALDAAFRMESWQRSEIERRRAEIARLRAEEEARLEAEERRNKIAQRLGTGVGRRQMATVDFSEAARASLAAGGAIYEDHRPSYQKGEMVVDFRVDNRHFQCVCDALQLNIIDSGICLTSHATGTKYDDRLTLESLPGVIRQAIREGKLVVYRHVGGNDDYGNDYEDD